MWPAVFKFAGTIGIDPWRLRYGELLYMAREHYMFQWDLNSTLHAGVLNASDKVKRRINPRELNPMRRGGSGIQITAENLKDLPFGKKSSNPRPFGAGKQG